jgi:hypothetical protein
MVRISPRDVYRSRFIGSVFGDSQMEMFLECFVITQFKANPDAWTPFSWNEYVARCDHKPIDAERRILEAMVNGGEVCLNDMGKQKRITIQKGYLTKEGDRYVIAEPLLKALAPHAEKRAG